MSEDPARAHLSLVPAEAGARLTRAQVAARLGVSVSTVRRYEGDKLHPTVGEDGVRYFAASDVERLASTLLAQMEASPRAREKAVERAAELSRGELAALVFERLEQRQSLAEIVVGLRIPPEDVRRLYREWLVGLCAGEVKQRDPAIPPMLTPAGAEWRVKEEELAALLGALPAGEPTRISIARDGGEWTGADDSDRRLVIELGGFVVAGPVDVDAIKGRHGPGTYRVTAYGVEPSGLRWEVFAPVGTR